MGSMILDGKEIYKSGVTVTTTIRYSGDVSRNSTNTNSLHII